MKFPNLPENGDLYRFDGRFYDLKEADGVLTLKLRPNVIRERLKKKFFAFSLFFTSSLFVMWAVNNIYPDFSGSSTGQGFNQAIFLLWLTVGNFLDPTFEEKWFCNKNSKNFRLNRKKMANLTEICGVKAWYNRANFYLALELQNGKLIKIGRFGFCRSEHAWRQDAAQIAAFLSVPLDIPPL